MMEFASMVSRAIGPDTLESRAVMAAEAAVNVAGWSLIVSFGLLAGAIVAARFAGGAWTAARDQATSANAQLQRAKSADEQKEASKVSAWLTQDGQTIQVHLLNLNDGPVYNVHYAVSVRPSDSQSPEPSIQLGHGDLVALPPYAADEKASMPRQFHPDGHVYAYTDPRDDTERTNSKSLNVQLKDESDWKLWDGQPTSSGIAIKLTFRDSANVTWQRAWNGTLTRES